jgi:hypothetical protein
MSVINHPVALKLHVLRLTREIMGRNMGSGGYERTEDGRFRQIFGCVLTVVLSLCSLLTEDDTVAGADVKHLLWALLFLKIYSNKATLGSISGGVAKRHS